MSRFKLQFLAKSEALQLERGHTVDFSSSEVADLPPRLRAVVEDNRVGVFETRADRVRRQEGNRGALKWQTETVGLRRERTVASGGLPCGP